MVKKILPGSSNEKVGKEMPPYALLLDNLEILLATTMDKAHGNTSGSLVESFIKPRASTIFGPLAYSLDGPRPSIEFSGPHEDFSDSSFGIWIGGEKTIWIMYTIRDSQIMEGLRTKEAYSGTAFKSTE